MARDFSRIDASGFLREDVSAAEVFTARWPASGVALGNGSKDYPSVTLDKWKLSIGDVVLITPEEKDDPCEMGFIRRLFSEGRKRMMKVQWVWRPEHLSIKEEDKPQFAENEVFTTDTTDEVSLDSIERPCVLVRSDEPVPFDDCTFFYRLMYDPDDEEFASLDPVGTAAAAPAPAPTSAPAPANAAAATKQNSAKRKLDDTDTRLTALEDGVRSLRALVQEQQATIEQQQASIAALLTQVGGSDNSN
jgi:uncharacterized coiled-coil protein SlyX